MGQMRWYKRDPDAALGGMMGLTLEERGAYNTVLDLIYSRNDNLIDDEFFVAGWCQVDVRVWRRIKASLIAKKKLATSDGLLRNFRATSEVKSASQRIQQKQQAGREGGIKSAASRNKNNELTEANAQATPEEQLESNSNTSRITSTTRIREEDGIRREREDWDALRDRLVEAAGWQTARANGKLEIIGPIATLIENGADLEADVLPVIRRDAPRIRSPNWVYFVNAIAQARDDRIRAATIVSPQGGNHVGTGNRERQQPRSFVAEALGLDRSDGG